MIARLLPTIAFAFGSLASAETWTVDDDAPADFAQVADAIAAAAPGDVLLVQAGSYDPFVLDRGLTILGHGEVNITGPVQAIGLAQRAALVGLNAPVLDVDACAAALVVQDSTFSRAIVAGSADVRFARCDVLDAHATTLAPAASAVRAVQSRVELEGCDLRGGWFLGVTGQSDPGGHGVEVGGGSRVHASRCFATGGFGALGSESIVAGDGGDGMRVESGAVAIVTGDGGQTFQHGSGGSCWRCGDCLNDGEPGRALRVTNGLAYYSGTWFPLATSCVGLHCVCIQSSSVVGDTLVPLSPQAPTLDAAGSMHAGTTVAFTIRAPAGSFGTLNLGRAPTVVDTPPILVEKLTSYLRTIHVVVPASGAITRDVLIPPGLPTGYLFVAQAELTLPDASVARTCSAPVVVR